MKLNIAICDDDEKDIEKLRDFLTSYYIARDTDLKIDSFTSGEDLFKSYTRANDYQILLLDVEMPSMNGLEVADMVRTNIDKHTIIVFISSYPKYMQDSFRVHPFYYLTKPVSLENIYDLMDNIVAEINDSHIIFSLIGTDEKSTTINIRDVLYIETENSKNGILNFHFKDSNIITKGTLSHWYNQLKDYNFYQCYKSILLNMVHIHYFNKHSVTLDNGEELPLGRKSEKELRELYLNRAVKLVNL